MAFQVNDAPVRLGRRCELSGKCLRGAGRLMGRAPEPFSQRRDLAVDRLLGYIFLRLCNGVTLEHYGLERASPLSVIRFILDRALV